MANNPLNLALRFFLELFGLFALGYWGWTQHTGWLRFVWTIGLPLLAATLWGTFRVPDDPGKAPVAVPGWVRLLLEAAYFGAAVEQLRGSGFEVRDEQISHIYPLLTEHLNLIGEYHFPKNGSLMTRLDALPLRAVDHAVTQIAFKL